MSINDIMAQIQDFGQLASRESLELVKNHMDIARRGGMTPSDCVERGLRFADLLVSDAYPDMRPVVKMQLALYIWEHSIREIGLHAEERRAQKIAQK